MRRSVASVNSDLPDLAPGVVLLGRYCIDRVVPTGSETAYLGHRLDQAGDIQVLALPLASVGPLRRALGVTHPSLCTLLEVLPHRTGTGVAVFEHARGRTLEQELEAQRVLPTRRAVQAALDVADALTAMHQRGAAHGLLRPAALVMEPVGRPGAVLGYAPLRPPPNPYHCPERGLGAPSPTDDVWALAAILHQMLVGEPPPSGGYRSKREVRAAGVEDPALVTFLANCLVRRPENRVSMVQPVRDMLLARLERLAREPPPVAQHPTTERAVDSAGAAEADERSGGVARVPHGAAPARLTRKTGALLGTVIGAGIVAAALGLTVAIDRSAPGPTDATGSSELARLGPPSAEPTEAAPEPPGPGELVSAESLPSGDDLAMCVTRQFPPKTFGEKVNMEWLCTTRDPRKGFSKMRAALVVGAGRGNLTQAMSIWARLQWYGMAAYAVIRGACCAGGEPMELPKSTHCPALDGPLAELSTLPPDSDGWNAALKAYTKGIRCRSGMGQHTFYGAELPLGGGQETALRELISARSAR